MDDPMSNGLSVGEPVADRVTQLAGVERRAGSRELALDQRNVAVADQAQLDRRGAGPLQRGGRSRLVSPRCADRVVASR
jgi:hypothetical protein